MKFIKVGGSTEAFLKAGPTQPFVLCVGERKNIIQSFYIVLDQKFADVACDNVTAMLNGSINTPFNPTSIFASIEVPRFKASRVKKLNVVMVIQKNNISNCTDPSLKNLTQALHTGITYSCKDVPESQIQECGAKPEIACGACW
ncbi:unnamed protein product [Oreochromis niloticus]|nr:unnamed protein product [Mustela putorius furo]